MSTRTELPWPIIHTQVNHAAKTFLKSNFVPSRQLAKYIIQNPDDYPNLINHRHSIRCIASRITMSAKKQGWKEWTAGDTNGGNRVFIMPDEVRG